jgi:23S rRNA (adenine1618-N6)-methyltransferase
MPKKQSPLSTSGMPAEDASAARKPLHPRNRHGGRYDFAQLINSSPELAAFVARNAFGDESIDFADPEAVRALNRALLLQVYGVTGWTLPTSYLCPPIPGRADYLHYLADLLAASNGGEIPYGAAIRVLDVGVGANCIYPLIGHAEYGWSFVGTDIDRDALACAQATIEANPGHRTAVQLRRQTSRNAIFSGVVQADELFDLTLCNPPFHASMDAAQAGTERKWRNLGKQTRESRPPPLNFGGNDAELCCEGGEEGFISRMIAESTAFRSNCLWFTTLVSKASNLPAVRRALKTAGVECCRTIEMAQGQKQSRFVAWSFFNERQQQAWRNRRRAESLPARSG